MPPSPNERAPPWLGRFFSTTSTHWTTARPIWIALIVLPLLFVTIGLCIAASGLVIGSTRTPTASTMAQQKDQSMVQVSPDEQIRRHQGEFRSLKRLRVRKLSLDQQSSSGSRKTRSKREALEPSTSSLVQKAATATPTIPNTSAASAAVSPGASNPTTASNNGTAGTATTAKPQANSTLISSNSSATADGRAESLSPHSSIATTSPFSVDTADNSTKGLPFPFPDTNDPRSIFPKEFSGPGSLLQNGSKCVQFTEEQLVKELKQHGTYNPDFMAWDVRGVLNFFERATTDNYDKLKKTQDRAMTVEQNLAAVEQLVKELNLQNCNLRTPDVLARLYNLSSITPPRAASIDPSGVSDYGRLRTKREELSDDDQQQQVDPILLAKAKYIYDLYSPNGVSRDDSSDAKSRSGSDRKSSSDHETIVGQVHVVPTGCRKRGSSEDGYLRLCSACQAIRRLPDTFFPPFLNEVTCDEDKACLYFYDYPHGKCRQKHLNLVVLKNVGTPDCQLWKRYNLNVRVSCECFVDEMSFFAKYV